MPELNEVSELDLDARESVAFWAEVEAVAFWAVAEAEADA